MNPGNMMATKSCSSEIVEAAEESGKVLSIVGTAGKRRVLKPGQICSVEDDINLLFETIDIRNSCRNNPGALKHKNSLRKSAMKRPMHYSSSGVGISESVSLKQALRGLCISQASEMAAMRRLSKQTGSSEAGTIKDMFKSVVVKATASGYPNHEVDIDIGSGTSKIGSQGPHTSIECDSNGKEADSPSSTGNVSDLNGIDVGPDRVKSDADSRNLVSRTDDSSRSREKGEFSQSSKSSIGEYSISTSISEESTLCGPSRGGYRPHMSKDLRWESIHHIEKHHGRLSLRHFKVLKKIGSGDIGNVYLAELIGRNCLFGLKVMDNEFLASRKKMGRAQIEREILQMLDHPFLPTLFSHFTTDKYLCLVMEYCPGGDLHVLRQKQPSKSFSEAAARFYVSEVLLALEYLHMLGVVYRDLKPENILIREDGHIMLSDFDLSFWCAVDPVPLLKSSNSPPKKQSSSPCTDSSCIHPFCLHHPSWQVPCFTPNFTSRPSKLKPDFSSKLPQFVAEPTGARSNSFVGTHEYLAPEVIKGEGHGSAVDWWALGIFLYELVYGRTPFKGSGNEDTLSNVTSQSLRFPSCPIVSSDTRDLIRGLLVKDPVNRLGASEGAAEIKQHPFFKGMNWALIRCELPPELPKISELGLSLQEKESTATLEEDASARDDDMEFEMF